MPLDPGLLLEGLVAVLLLATIVYCAILYRRLAGLRGGQQEMRQLIAEFDEATGRAEAGVAELKAANAAILNDLGAESRKARALADELSVLTDSGARLADRIDGGLSRTADRAGPRPAAAGDRPMEGPGPETGAGIRSEAERELLAALREAR